MTAALISSRSGSQPLITSSDWYKNYSQMHEQIVIIDDDDEKQNLFVEIYKPTEIAEKIEKINLTK